MYQRIKSAQVRELLSARGGMGSYRRGPLLPGELSKGSTLMGMGGILDTLGTALTTIVSGAAGAIAPHFTSVNGVCKPTDTATLNLFKDLQRQLNRCAAIKSFNPIGVDGDIGGGTVSLMQNIQLSAKADLQAGKLTGLAMNAATALALVESSTCSGIASMATQTAGDLKTYADALGVSSSVASPSPAQPPAVYDPVKGVAAPQSMAASAIDAFKNMSTGAQLATAGAIGVAGYLVLAGGKKKRRK